MSKLKEILKSNIKSENLKYLYEEIRLMRNQSYLIQNEKSCIDIINLVVEYLIYGDKNDELIFDTFCEYNFMVEFIFLASLKNRNISVEIIRNFALLVLNISNTSTLYYLFSNNFINHIISQNIENFDDDFIAYYLNFIKSLSQKIDHDTIQFFYQEQHNTFQLLQCTMRFYNHPDTMVKTIVRNIFLTFLKLRYIPLYNYFTSLPSISYFPNLVCVVKDLVIKLSNKIQFGDFKNIFEYSDEITDFIIYFQDIFSLKIEKISMILTNCLFYYLICPLLIDTFTNQKPIISLQISIYMITLMFKYIKDETFLNLLFIYLFSEKISKGLYGFIVNKPRDPYFYNFTWENSAESKTIGYSEYISTHFSENFINSLIFQNNSQFDQVRQISQKFINGKENLSTEEFNKKILEEVLSQLNQEEFDFMMIYQKSLSLATGTNLGFKIIDNSHLSVLNQAKIFVSQIDSQKNKMHVPNETRENLMLFLKSKDDSLVLSLNLLINIVLKSNVSRILLSVGKLLPGKFFEISEGSSLGILKEIFNNIEENSSDNKVKTYVAEKKEEIRPKNFSELDFERPNEINNYDNLYNLENLGNLISMNSDLIKLEKRIAEYLNLDNEFMNSNVKYIKPQYNYDEDLISDLLYLVSLEPAFRTITLSLIIENIESLILGSSIKKVHLDLINKIYFNTLCNIKIFISNHQEHNEKCYELFENEWNSFKKDLSVSLTSIISKPFIILPFNLEDKFKDFPLNLKTMKTDIDNFRNLLSLFLYLFELRSKILLNSNTLKDKFPLAYENLNKEPGKLLPISECEFEIYVCKVKIGKNSSYVQYYLAFENNHLYLCFYDRTSNQQNLLIKYRYSLSNMKCKIDSSDAKIVNIVIKDKTTFIDLIINADEGKYARRIIEILNESNRLGKSSEFAYISSYFEDLINKWSYESI